MQALGNLCSIRSKCRLHLNVGCMYKVLVMGDEISILGYRRSVVFGCASCRVRTAILPHVCTLYNAACAVQSNASYSDTKSGIQHQHLCPIVAHMC